MGVCAALQPQDLVLCHHRMIGWALCKGVPLEALVGELLGKEAGLAQGRCGEMHLRAPEYGLMHTFQLVGTVVPVAAGVAWAVKHVKKTGGIVVAVHGDAATANGQWHEGLNIAAVNRLPLLLVCENNGLAGNVTMEHYSPATPSVISRATGYATMSDWPDGNDVEAVRTRTVRARERILYSERPLLLDCLTNRMGKHKQGMGDLRGPEEMARLQAQDPLRDVTPLERAEAEAVVHDVLERARML